MEICDYIVTGGEDLNALRRKTLSFPSEAEQIFDNWRTKLGKDDAEEENYLEIPAAKNYRLFIKQYWVEKPGCRPICYFVGYLLTKEMYINAGEYYLLNRGISSINIDMVLSASEANIPLPLHISLAFPLPRTSIWTPFQELSTMRLYGDSDFDANLKEMCLAISVNNIDDWFTKLFIAVNPYRMNQAYNLVLARKEPLPEIPEKITSNKKSIEHTQKTVSQLVKNKENVPSLPKKISYWVICIFTVLLFLNCVALIFNYYVLKKIEDNIASQQSNYTKLYDNNIKIIERIDKLEKKLEKK